MTAPSVAAPRILIIEDQLHLAAMIQRRLQSQGYLCEHAADGLSALKMILASPFDLLLLDLYLPGLHGIELLRKLRASSKTRALPVVAMSGIYKGERYRRALQDLGVPDLLEKPFTPKQLQTAITSALKGIAPAAVEPPVTSTSFDRHLTQALLRSLSGELLLHDGQTTRQLILVNGSPVSLRPGFVHRDFGDYLLRQGVISAEEYDYYARATEFRHDLLVQMGSLRYRELLEQKFSYLSQELLAGFSSPALAARFHPLTLPAGLQVISVNLADIILQGVRSTWRAARGAAYLLHLKDRYLGRTPAYFRYINSLTLTPEESLLLPRLDGSQRGASILAGKEDLLPLIYLFQSFGMLTVSDVALTAPSAPPWPLRVLFHAPPEQLVESVEMENFADLLDPPAVGAQRVASQASPHPPEAGSDVASEVRAAYNRMQGKNYYEILGLSPGKFSFNQLKESYFTISKEFGPDLLMRLGGEEASQAEAILSMVANAYETLSDVVKKEKYDQLLGSEKIGLGHKGDERFRAEVQAQSGKVFIDMEEWDNAEKTLKDACALEPDNGDTLAHLAWAIYRNPQYAASRPTLERAKQMLNRAITMERTAPAFAFKGWMLIDGGQEMLAEAEFNKALKIDARNVLARKGVRLIQEKRAQEKKGLFGRMFGG